MENLSLWYDYFIQILSNNRFIHVDSIVKYKGCTSAIKRLLSALLIANADISGFVFNFRRPIQRIGSNAFYEKKTNNVQFDRLLISACRV